MTIRKHALIALATLSVVGILLPGCGGKSGDEAPAAAKDGMKASREGGDAGTTGAAGTPTTGGSTATPQPPDSSSSK